MNPLKKEPSFLAVQSRHDCHNYNVKNEMYCNEIITIFFGGDDELLHSALHFRPYYLHILIEWATYQPNYFTFKSYRISLCKLKTVISEIESFSNLIYFIFS